MKAKLPSIKSASKPKVNKEKVQPLKEVVTALPTKSFPTTETPVDMKLSLKSRSKRTTIILGVLIGTGIFLLIVLIISGGLYLITRSRLNANSDLKSDNKMSTSEMASVLERMGKLTILPSESPIMASIVNAKFLGTQSEFYKDAQDGDKIVIFPKAQKAYIYSPSRNIIVNTGPIIADSPSPKP